ncbi:hypothetical protein Tco_0323889 [Tanacetum coccineum]
MENENPPCTLRDYSRPSHEGYRNTTELPDGNNVVPLRSNTIRLVQNGSSFHKLWSEDPKQHLKDFLKTLAIGLNVFLRDPSLEGLTLERCSTFGKKDKLEPSYVGPFEILGWIGPIVRLKIYVLWAEYRKLDWEFLFDELRVKVRWDSKRGPELTWERKDQMRSRELKRNGNVMVIIREVFAKLLLDSFGKLSIRCEVMRILKKVEKWLESDLR